MESNYLINIRAELDTRIKELETELTNLNNVKLSVETALGYSVPTKKAPVSNKKTVTVAKSSNTSNVLRKKTTKKKYPNASYALDTKAKIKKFVSSNDNPTIKDIIDNIKQQNGKDYSPQSIRTFLYSIGIKGVKSK